VASQQGKYLGHKLHLLAAKRDTLLANELPPTTDEAVSGPFNYRHLGSLAYIGNAAVFDLGRLSFMGGLAAMYAWRSIYWSEQVSMRTRALLMIDWIVRCVPILSPVVRPRLIFGMDIAVVCGAEICRDCSRTPYIGG